MKRYTDLFSGGFRIAMFILVFVPLIAIADSCAVFPAQLRATPGPTVTPDLTDVFTTLPPGTQLPGEAECVHRVHRSSWEPRPDNETANHSVPTAEQIAGLVLREPDQGQDAKVVNPSFQITGNFTGTTDEILQWVSCKWGIDVNIVRAQAAVESGWHQNETGDLTNDTSLCPPGTWDGTSCYQSYGILQVKYIDNKTTWPMTRDDTAFSAEYTYRSIRSCFEGWVNYLYSITPSAGYLKYHSGDLWGCIGWWYSGSWYDQGAITYMKKVKEQLAAQLWLRPGF